MVNINLPTGVDRSKPSRKLITFTPLARKVSTVDNTSIVLRPKRSIPTTIKVSPSRM
ncbi:hypothetical protein UUU_07290 [Klebsiella pneumoniae subsp. pneumoniae DSM 30104 = JCM 1662 = NBRC 14940]|nr:hypothetical protein UUU_07290 [Klebsiella pneumoniae subsp. pneumoniae DSM 30104 = JCM 1662 = NBRC 14940]